MTEQTVFQRLLACAERWPERAFINLLPETAAAYQLQARTYSYAETVSETQRRQIRFQSAGLGRGQRVGILLHNRPQFLFNWFALNALGVSVVPINPDLRSAELEYLISHSEMCLAIVSDERQRDIAAAIKTAGSHAHIVSDNQQPRAAGNTTSTALPDSATECALLYTSGTSGQPKGCVLANEYFIVAGDWYSNAGGLMSLTTHPAEHMLTPLPLFHMNAMACSVMAMMTVGGCLTVLDRFHPSSWWQSVHDSGASIVHYLGMMPSILMAQTDTALDTDHQVRFGFGAGVDPALHEEFEHRHGFPLIEAWAMTETGNGAVIAANLPPREIGSNCLGSPEATIEAMLIDDLGQPAAIDENGEQKGELLVRRHGDKPRYGFFSEYLKDPKASAEAWQGGWFHTGDIVKKNRRGAIFFVDRKKNVIRRSGENIAAVEVESVLAQCPGVDQLVVAATPDSIRGDEVLAMVVASETTSSAKELAHALVAYSLSRLAYYKAPGYVALVDNIPLTATGKIQRGEVKALAHQVMQSGDTVDTRELKKRQPQHA